MLKSLLLISIFALAAFASTIATYEELNSMWETWKTRHQKIYSEVEEAHRFAIFVENHFKVLQFNEENDTPKLALNKFADLTAEEFKSLKSGCAFKTNPEIVREHTLGLLETGNLPASVDWRNKGAVTGVKDQGDCGSCWTFSTTGVLEGNYFLQNGKLLSFSEQQIVDCDKGENEGCEGGWPYLAVEYAGQNGLEEEDDYPYTGTDGTCNYKKLKAYDTNKNYSFVTANSTDQLKAALVNMPVSVGIEADQDVFQLYSSGVIRRNCGAELDHAVLAVGYEKVGLYEAWIVKNSWGSDWGKDGYVWISTNSKPNKGQGVCGILAEPVIPTN